MMPLAGPPGAGGRAIGVGALPLAVDGATMSESATVPLVLAAVVVGHRIATDGVRAARTPTLVPTPTADSVSDTATSHRTDANQSADPSSTVFGGVPRL